MPNPPPQPPQYPIVNVREVARADCANGQTVVHREVIQHDANPNHDTEQFTLRIEQGPRENPNLIVATFTRAQFAAFLAAGQTVLSP